MTATAITLKNTSAVFRVLMWGAPFSLSLADSCISWSHFHCRNKSHLSIPTTKSGWPPLKHLLIHECSFVLACLFSLCTLAGARTEGAWSLGSSFCVTLGESLCSLPCFAVQCWGGDCRGGGDERTGAVCGGLSSDWGSQQWFLSPHVASTAHPWAAGAEAAPPAVPAAGSAC